MLHNEVDHILHSMLNRFNHGKTATEIIIMVKTTINYGMIDSNSFIIILQIIQYSQNCEDSPYKLDASKIITIINICNIT